MYFGMASALLLASDLYQITRFDYSIHNTGAAYEPFFAVLYTVCIKIVYSDRVRSGKRMAISKVKIINHNFYAIQYCPVRYKFVSIKVIQTVSIIV